MSRTTAESDADTGSPPEERCAPISGGTGAVASAHPLATAAGLDVLLRGGSAADAAIAAQAVIGVVMPHAAGVGGDLLALHRDPRGRVHAINGVGASSMTAPERLATEGGASVTVPGLVDGWERLHRYAGRLPFADLFTAAIRLAEGGVVVDLPLAVAVRAQRRRLERYATDWELLSLAPGDLWRQPELAATLARVAQEGGRAFAHGKIAAAVSNAARRAGGTLSEDDLAAHAGDEGPALSVAWQGGTLHVQPPSSQGVLLALAASWADESAGEALAAGADLDHLLVEATEAAFQRRDRCGEGNRLLAEPLDVDPWAAARRGGPRAYLHTAGAAAADASGAVVSSLVSVFDDFGSAIYVPEGGFVLNDRAAGFTSGGNAPGPGRKPVHTLAPALLVDHAGLPLAFATPGADGQVQTLLQVLARRRFSGASLAEALAAPRWRSENGAVLVEAGHPAAQRLQELGHDVVLRPRGDDVFGSVVAAGWLPEPGGPSPAIRPFAAADWRRAARSGAV